MTKLRTLVIKGFRGARFELRIDFTGNYASLSIYGENAGGKSTITDALEWFFCARVEHLWREDCKEDSLRNVFLDASEASEVSAQFSDAGLNGTKSLGPDLKSKFDNTSAAFQAFVNGVRDERVFLRHAQITKFIDQTKSKKREEIAAIIGYQDVLDFRDAIQGACNALRKETRYTTANNFPKMPRHICFS